MSTVFNTFIVNISESLLRNFTSNRQTTKNVLIYKQSLEGGLCKIQIIKSDIVKIN